MKFDSSIKAIVSGGVSGLGGAVAEKVIAAGGQVAMLDISDDKGAAMAARLGPRARYIRCNVAAEKEVGDAVAAAKAAFGGLNLAVNCAGVLGAGRVLGREGPMALSFFTHTVMINLVGSFNVARAAAHRMEHNAPGPHGERGLIVN